MSSDLCHLWDFFSFCPALQDFLIYFTGPRCLADHFQKYLQALGHRGPFYRRPLPSGLRYGEAVVGVNKIKTFMSTICQKAGIQGNFTNHSGKRTCATSLYDAGIDEQEIMSRTGHRSEKAVRLYKRATPAVTSRTSAALDPPPAKCVKLETSEYTTMKAEDLNPALNEAASKPKLPVREPFGNLTNQGASFSNCVFHFTS